MDPLTSLSVASSAIQIIDFGSKVWCKAKEVYESEIGASTTHRNLVTDAKRLCALNSQLGKLLTPQNLQRGLTQTEENVVGLCAECDSAAEELLAAFEKLSVKGDSEAR
jgi:hypothetical protein